MNDLVLIQQDIPAVVIQDAATITVLDSPEHITVEQNGKIIISNSDLPIVVKYSTQAGKDGLTPTYEEIVSLVTTEYLISKLTGQITSTELDSLLANRIDHIVNIDSSIVELQNAIALAITDNALGIILQDYSTKLTTDAAIISVRDALLVTTNANLTNALVDRVIGPLSAVDNNFASYDLTTGKLIKDSGVNSTSFDAAGTTATHATLTVAHGATGAVVGTTNTQTLTNKTLNNILNYVDADALHLKAYNASGGALTIGSTVRNTQYNTGSQAAEFVRSTAVAGQYPCHGVWEETLSGNNGSVRTNGYLFNVDTRPWSDGEDLWLATSTTNSGVVLNGMTNVEPTAVGAIKQLLGTVVKQGSTASDGIILIQIGTASVIPSAGGGGGAVDSVNGQTGVVVLTIADIDSAIDTTYTNLLNAVGSFVPNQKYRMTNFRTNFSYDDGSGESINFVGAIEPIIVTAIDANSLHPQAYSESFPQDEIYYELVCSELDFAGTSPAYVRGRIFRRVHPLLNIDIACDFRNYQTRLWKRAADSINYSNTEPTAFGSEMFPLFSSVEGTLIRSVVIQCFKNHKPLVFLGNAEKVIVSGSTDGIVCLGAASDIHLGSCSYMVAEADVYGFFSSLNSRFWFRNTVTAVDAGSGIFADNWGFAGALLNTTIAPGYTLYSEVTTDIANEAVGIQRISSDSLTIGLPEGAKRIGTSLDRVELRAPTYKDEFDVIQAEINRTVGQNCIKITTDPVTDVPIVNFNNATIQNFNGPAGGAVSITQVEVDFGEIPVTDMEFIITDATVLSTSKIMASTAYEDTADNTADEVIANAVICSAGKAVDGSFTLMVASLTDALTGRYKFNYIVG